MSSYWDASIKASAKAKENEKGKGSVPWPFTNVSVIWVNRSWARTMIYLLRRHGSKKKAAAIGKWHRMSFVEWRKTAPSDAPDGQMAPRVSSQSGK